MKQVFAKKRKQRKIHTYEKKKNNSNKEKTSAVFNEQK